MEIEKIINHKFTNPEIIKTALTHRSYLNEHSGYKNPSNERLEFLGDAILQFLVSEYLYANYPTEPEGMMTNFRAATVCTPSLAAESKRLDFGNQLLMSRGEEKSGGRDKEYILANTFEAVLGAIYLDSLDLNFCREYLTTNLFYKIADIVQKESYKDAKSHLQELAQEKRGITPNYKVGREWGLDHDRQFEVGVYLHKEIVGKGVGSSKQRAETAAAEDALAKWPAVS